MNVLHPLALADTADGLQRIQVDLVAPPQVHAHEQAVTNCTARGAVAHGDPGEESGDRQSGHHPAGDDLRWLDAWPDDGGPRGRLCGADPGHPATTSMPHNIDFHAAKLSVVAPGREVVLRFKADRSGTFVYHCAPEGMPPTHLGLRLAREG